MSEITGASSTPLNVFLLSPESIVKVDNPHVTAGFDQLRAGFAIQSKTAHTLALDPESADLIIAPVQGNGYGRCLEALRSSAVFRKFAHKIVAYSPDDNQFPAMRGLYPAAPREWVRKGWALPAHYVSSHIHKFAFKPEVSASKDILFSFVGSSRNHPIREQIVQWKYPGAAIVDASSKNEKDYWWVKPNVNEFFDSFKDVTRRSKFVLCPRGVSPSSIRLFEVMEAASVPVIIADELELPLGPAWETFSIRVLERDVESIPKLLDSMKDRALGMGTAARRAWEEHFSEEATVGSMVGWAKMLLARTHRRSFMLSFEEYTSPWRLNAKLRQKFRKL